MNKIRGGADGFSEKPNKKRLRKLSVVGKMSKNCEMDSDSEDEFQKFELPRKFSDDCNASAHSAVPRKLRTAMKKRRRKTISPQIPDSGKPNYVIDGVEPSRRYGLKKSKLSSQKQRDMRKSFAAAITKDEEEVVEALYSLSSMFRTNDGDDIVTSTGEIAEAKSSDLLETDNNVEENEVSTIKDCSNSTANGDPNPSDIEGEAHENNEVKSFEESSEPEPDALLMNSEATDTKLSNISFDVPYELTLGRSQQPEHAEIEACDTYQISNKNREIDTCEIKTEIAMKPAAETRNQHELQHSVKDNKIRELHYDGIPAPSSQSSPAWWSNSASTIQPARVDLNVSAKKDSRVRANEKKPWKKCAVHVHITHLIKGLTSEGSRLQPPKDERVNVAPRNLNGPINSLNGIVCGNRPSDNKNVNEVKNARLLQDQQQASTSSGLCTLQKQSFDLLSLSAGGGGGLEANNNTYNKARNYRQSVAKNHHPLMPFYMSENNYSNALSDHHLKAISLPQVQQPLYIGSPSRGPPPDAGMTQQQQHRLWVGQMAARYYKPEGTQEDYVSLQAPPPPPPSYAPISQAQAQAQQQQLMYMASSPMMPPSRAGKEHHRLPFGYYVGNGGGTTFYPDGTPSLQLLCNEKLI